MAVLGHLGAASEHVLMERMLTLRPSLVTPTGVCRHKDGETESQVSRRGRWNFKKGSRVGPKDPGLHLPQLRSFKKKGENYHLIQQFHF